MQQVIIDQFSATVRAAAENSQPLHIRGGGSKSFYGHPPSEHAEILDVSPYQGITEYEPTELVITARAGTPLAEIESLLRQNSQMLAFEPPYFSETATLGGCVAAGLSGPRRASAGAVRDFVLGVRILDGTGHDLHFGGQVMKNVAGYDVSRLMVGAMGTLGVLLEVSLKVLPLPAVEQTICLEMGETEAIEYMNRWAGKPLSVSATCHVNERLYMRLSGAESAVRAAHTQLGGEAYPAGDAFWKSVREHSHDFFKSPVPLWRLSVKSTTPPLSLSRTKQLIEWNGALRWLTCPKESPVDTIRQAAQKAGGHATLFRRHNCAIPVFQELSPALAGIHQRLKQKFDPAGILNPGRLYPEF
ncbi:glycolate oxidase subunit GlcE [Nitrosomonas sp.]|uniref:glycolate oxidase subunit GlcE n=1 Tax=Nitrosomonas sp. TaxID=42353 RepID=UPI00284288B2|nr:glycolate oxidase subunit GlcE [Nitrosomonas sp.]MDR4515580.1 glycolate oxidase subunit GlcE [Nitrosomonas sp.]